MNSPTAKAVSCVFWNNPSSPALGKHCFCLFYLGGFVLLLCLCNLFSGYQRGIIHWVAFSAWPLLLSSMHLWSLHVLTWLTAILAWIILAKPSLSSHLFKDSCLWGLTIIKWWCTLVCRFLCRYVRFGVLGLNIKEYDHCMVKYVQSVRSHQLSAWCLCCVSLLFWCFVVRCIYIRPYYILMEIWLSIIKAVFLALNSPLSETNIAAHVFFWLM